MIRMGVIGVGAMGSHHARILSDLPGAGLVGVYDRNGRQAAAVASRYATRAFASPEALLAEVDAVVVAVPTELHYEIGRQALAAGCHVLMEKPLAHDLQTAGDLCRQAAALGQELMVGYVERFNPAVARLRDLLDGEDLLSLTFTRVGPEPPRSGETGVILDLAIHDLDLLLHLSGREVIRTTALAAGLHRQDTAALSFLMEGGLLAHVSANWLTPFKVREIQAATPKRFYRCDLIHQQLTEYSRLSPDQGYAVREVPVASGEPLRRELGAFVRALAAGEPVPVPGEDGLRSLRLAEQCVAVSMLT